MGLQVHAVNNRIVAIVHSVTDPAGKDFVAPAARIAVFDSEGPPWTGQPLYCQAFYTPAK